MPTARRAVALSAIACLLAVPAPAVAADGGQLSGRIERSRSRDRQLQAERRADQQRVSGFQPRIDELRRQLGGIEPRLAADRAALERLQAELRDSRTRLVGLRAQDARDQRVLADQLVAVYEAPRTDLVTIALDSHGFADLLDRVGQLRRIAQRNADVTVRVRREHQQVAAETRRLTRLQSQQASRTAAIQTQHDAIAQVKLELVEQQLRYVRSRDRTSAQLATLRSTRKGLERQLDRIQAAQMRALSGGVAPGDGGGSGFFPASGTNYTYGDEPQIAARLTRMAHALHLHLIGLSGYRTPQHSIEVGGFPNDPHTRGEASDTPGLEGVPEATLRRFGLTRPFAGAAEADHVQLVGSI
ncbi:hypothetical protein [Patulibacter defluvii]|uniref:hypothetical protein n=1 Tax=Patulibacter defluvii TaxID=3095358 RepID=UPI002A766334|nr:hypothetical protein [Patulibacter sp. DM4]